MHDTHFLENNLFAELDNPLSPKLADKQATEDDLNIDGGIKACFNLFLN